MHAQWDNVHVPSNRPTVQIHLLFLPLDGNKDPCKCTHVIRNDKGLMEGFDMTTVSTLWPMTKAQLLPACEHCTLYNEAK